MKLRSHCPINFSLEHFGDKWSLLILRDLMFKEKRHYNEFLDSEEKVSTSVLGNRLKLLEKLDIITKSTDDVKKSRIKYSLTRKGLDMLPILIEMIVWGGMYDSYTAASTAFLSEAKEDRAYVISEIRKKLEKEHLMK